MSGKFIWEVLKPTLEMGGRVIDGGVKLIVDTANGVAGYVVDVLLGEDTIFSDNKEKKDE